MERYEFKKCMELRERVKNRVKGGVFIGINRDSLTVTINGGRGIRYTRNINDIPYRIDYDKMTDEIVYDYKKFIINRFIF